MSVLTRAKSMVVDHQFAWAITLAVLIACLMTAVSLSLYVSTGAIQLDLSRPGYETARKEIIKPTNTPDFAAYGVIDVKTLDEYQERFDSQRTSLNKIGKFKDKSLEDDSLSLSVPAPPSP